MPVQKKNNAQRHYNETEEMYSNSIIDLDDSDTGTSPPLYIPPPAFRPISHLPQYNNDDGDQSEREAMTHPTYQADRPPPEPPRVSPIAIGHTQPLPEPVHASVQPRPKDTHAVSHAGHVRSPILAREPSTLESFSRTIRNYVPSSIPIPSASPTPPRVSRPVSFGSFLTPVRTSAPATRVLSPPGHALRKRGSDSSHEHRRHFSDWRDQFTADELHSAVFNLDEDAHGTLSPPRYPSGDTSEEIVWSRWDSLPAMDGISQRRVLLIGYRTGLQIWDCTDLGSISEILNLSGTQWTDIRQVQVLPPPSLRTIADSLAEQRPLLGILRTVYDLDELLFYSLQTHQIIHTASFQSFASFYASPQFLIVATSRPAALHVLSSSTFISLYSVPSSIILPFTHTQSTEISNTVLSGQLDQDMNPHSHISAIPQPIFASHNRLLAFASITTTPDATRQSSSRTPRPAAQETLQESALRLPTSQAELSNAALKFGGSVLSGMKVLGGMAFTAARAGVTAAMAADSNLAPTNHHSPPAPGKFFSRSAPAASGYADVYSGAFSPIPDDTVLGLNPDRAHTERERNTLLSHEEHPRPKGGYTIAVYDLNPLIYGASVPRLITEFVASKDQAVSKITFSHDGTSLVVAFKDGQTMKLFKLRPIPSAFVEKSASSDIVRRVPSGHPTSASEAGLHLHSPWHVYDLKRGRTFGIVESLDCAADGRWVAVGTRKRTVHLFATNPYGGPSNDGSYVAGKVVNVKELPFSTELDPILRIRALKAHRAEQQSLPLAFTFVSRSTLASSSSDPIPRSLSPSSYSSGRSAPTSPTYAGSPRQGQDQDVLIFDPQDGILSLRRLTLSQRSQESTAGPAASPRVNASISLPGVSTIHRLAGTATTPSQANQSSALTKLMSVSSRLVCRESHIATWTLRRNTDWKEIKQPISNLTGPVRKLAKSEWLAQAELSTCSHSARLVPRSIYLKHQFSFFYLSEDYHALIRSYHLDVPATKVEVRRQVEVSASGAATGESFVSGSSLPSHLALPSSFDEPLASALSAELRNSKSSPSIIPMYPNGLTSRSLRPAIPIRNVAVGISDGMSEGLGRLRREIGKVRSPRLIARSGDSVSASVPLEFDEEDEDFLPLDVQTQGRDSRATSREGASVSTPSTDIEPLPTDQEGDVSWDGWSNEDKQAVDEVEQFDDIGVGYMDEEWPHGTIRTRS